MTPTRESTLVGVFALLMSAAPLSVYFQDIGWLSLYAPRRDGPNDGLEDSSVWVCSDADRRRHRQAAPAREFSGHARQSQPRPGNLASASSRDGRPPGIVRGDANRAHDAARLLAPFGIAFGCRGTPDSWGGGAFFSSDRKRALELAVAASAICDTSCGTDVPICWVPEVAHSNEPEAKNTFSEEMKLEERAEP